MIAAIVRFKLSDDFSAEKAHSAFVDSIPKFVRMDGLIRKYFLLAEDARSAGAVYLWSDRASAQAFFTEDWMEFIAAKYGHRPEVAYFACPVVVDNHTGEVITDLG